MPDTTKCQDYYCLRATRCWRFMAPASAWQSWFTESPRVKDECEHFWRMEEAREGAKASVPSHGAREKA